MEELECYNQEFKKRLDEVGALGEIPDDLALEVMRNRLTAVSYTFCSNGILFSTE